jgi:hypothetical protein
MLTTISGSTTRIMWIDVQSSTAAKRNSRCASEYFSPSVTPFTALPQIHVWQAFLSLFLDDLCNRSIFYYIYIFIVNSLQNMFKYLKLSISTDSKSWATLDALQVNAIFNWRTCRAVKKSCSSKMTFASITNFFCVHLPALRCKFCFESKSFATSDHLQFCDLVPFFIILPFANLCILHTALPTVNCTHALFSALPLHRPSKHD